MTNPAASSNVRNPPQTANRFILDAGWQGMFAAVGAPLDACIKRADLTPSIAHEERPSLTTEELLRLVDALESLVEPDAFVANVRSYLRTAPPPAVLASIASPDLRSALHRYSECKKTCTPMALFFQREGEHTVVTIDWFVEPERVGQALVVLTLARILDVAEWGVGERINPVRLECANANEIPRAFAEAHLGMPLEKGPAMRIVFLDRDLDRPFKTSNPEVLEVLDRHFAQTLAERTSSWSQEVQLWLGRLLPARDYGIETIARRLGTSSRTLQRELMTEGVRFTDLLDTTRASLARHYLACDRFSPKEVAFLLDYSEPAAFHRAFKRWTGETPNEYSTRTRTAQ